MYFLKTKQHLMKCLHSSSDHPPTSFYLVRLISKTPCMVLRLGFPIGTPAHVRNKVPPVNKVFRKLVQTHFSAAEPASLNMVKFSICFRFSVTLYYMVL